MVQFIHQDLKHRSLSESDRRTVRKVSNTAAAATRKARGASAKVNTLQLPDFLVIGTPSESDSTAASTHSEEDVIPLHLQQTPRRTVTRRPAWWNHHPGALSSERDYATPIATPLSQWPDNRKSPEFVSLLMQPGLSQKLLMDASSVDVNSDPKRWVKICRLTSILQFLPHMIGHSKCLDYAIDCLAERVRQCCIQIPDVALAQTQLEKRYGRALQCLQNALDSAQSIDWTVWYTTLLLALFELLATSSHHAWILHAQGAKQILLTLGPHNIKSEYEKILLAAQCQILTIEAIFNNRDCFLSSRAWQKAIETTMSHNSKILDRSEPVVTMWAITACAPGLFRRVTEAVLHHHLPEQNEKLADELCALLDRYATWRDKWEQTLVGEDFPIINDATLATAGPTIYPQYLAFWALTHRFLLAIQPHRAPVAETNSINAALRIIEFDQLRETDSVTDLCRTFALSIGRSIKQTTMEWTMQQYVSHDFQTIEPAVFLRWNSLLGRAIEDDAAWLPSGMVTPSSAGSR
ncbi:hypothetical protein H2200_009639 [Cladophialophora chaetospira]|uniref:Uncharacterized protein n=1 Tax=Cladophialophora chaetospira TaxID=386627 RepID=A0AA38X2W9_9EURO|nr:hypothetical protein H2200_009639 [Cladophialophora chaetospira]